MWKVVSRERFLALIKILPNIEDVSDSFGVCSFWGIYNFVGGFILLVGGAKSSHVELKVFHPRKQWICFVRGRFLVSYSNALG